MIKDQKPLSITESLTFVGDGKDSETEVKKFMKKFIKLKPEKAKELGKKIEDLEFLKIKPEHIVKIIDILPEDTENLNKIFNDVSLDENETKQILGLVEEFK